MEHVKRRETYFDVDLIKLILLFERSLYENRSGLYLTWTFPPHLRRDEVENIMFQSALVLELQVETRDIQLIRINLKLCHLYCKRKNDGILARRYFIMTSSHQLSHSETSYTTLNVPYDDEIRSYASSNASRSSITTSIPSSTSTEIGQEQIDHIRDAFAVFDKEMTGSITTEQFK